MLQNKLLSGLWIRSLLQKQATFGDLRGQRPYGWISSGLFRFERFKQFYDFKGLSGSVVKGLVGRSSGSFWYWLGLVGDQKKSEGGEDYIVGRGN